MNVYVCSAMAFTNVARGRFMVINSALLIMSVLSSDIRVIKIIDAKNNRS